MRLRHQTNKTFLDNKEVYMEKCVFEVEHECSALTKKECDGCPFHKTAEQIEKGVEKTERRLDSIPGGLYFYKKYHCSNGGKNA